MPGMVASNGDRDSIGPAFLRGVDSPTFVIERRWPDRGLYHTYEKGFSSLWERGRLL